MARFNVHMEDEEGEFHSISVEADDHGQAADLASEQHEDWGITDVEEEDE